MRERRDETRWREMPWTACDGRRSGAISGAALALAWWRCGRLRQRLSRTRPRADRTLRLARLLWPPRRDAGATKRCAGGRTGAAWAFSRRLTRVQDRPESRISHRYFSWLPSGQERQRGSSTTLCHLAPRGRRAASRTAACPGWRGVASPNPARPFASGVSALPPWCLGCARVNSGKSSTFKHLQRKRGVADYRGQSRPGQT